MDPLLRGEFISFSIDEISPSLKQGRTLNARIIPDIESKYFPPLHLRNIYVSVELIDPLFYESLTRDLPELGDFEGIKFIPSVKQGGYYRIPTNIIPENIFKGQDVIITPENNIFQNNMLASPYEELDIRGEDIIEIDSEKKIDLSGPEKLDNLYLYCFYVGQGDSFLLITPSGNAYIIDTNIYFDQPVDRFTAKIKTILRRHNLDNDKLKGLFITHKHLDHLRGSDSIINSDNFNIENLFINLDYHHPTAAANRLLQAAQNKIMIWFNINKPAVLYDGSVKLKIVNPSDTTSNNVVSPDINNSSICLLVEYGESSIYMTGDAGNIIINSSYPKHNPNEGDKLLKVSHHGSRTGTNDETVSMLNPTHSFISAGDSRRYRHPHPETLRYLRGRNRVISKEQKSTVCYEVKSDGEINCFRTWP